MARKDFNALSSKRSSKDNYGAKLSLSFIRNQKELHGILADTKMELIVVSRDHFVKAIANKKIV